MIPIRRLRRVVNAVAAVAACAVLVGVLGFGYGTTVHGPIMTLSGPR